MLAYNNALQSGHALQLVRYRFRLPKDITGKISLTATVKYRRYNQHFLDYAMDQKPGQHYPMPIIDQATETKTFNIGDNAPVPPDPSENKEWMRWNNYGITLLDGQQYPAAVHAFPSALPLCARTTPMPTSIWRLLKPRGNAMTTPSRTWRKL